MAVRLGNAVLLGKFPRSHEGSTPFSVRDSLLATDAVSDVLLLAQVPKQFTIKNVAGEIVVAAEGGGTGVTVDLVLCDEEGNVASTLMTGVDVSTVDAITPYAEVAAAGAWRVEVTPQVGADLYLGAVIAGGTLADLNFTVGGHYAAGLDRLGGAG